MPKLLRVHAAHAYIAHPIIHNVYNNTKGGLGTVNAINNEQPMLIIQAMTSMKKRNRLDL
jgi:hypothetical protein